MTSNVNRRRFLTAAGTSLAAGVAASAGVSALAAESSPPAIPLPDANTAKPAPGTGQTTVCCSPAAKPIYACSGAADVGEIADHAARKLTSEGLGKMSCLAGIGGRIPNLLEIARGAQVILAIDGCPMHCARHALEKAGFAKFEHICLADLGMTKGKTPATAEAVAKVVGAGKGKLGG